MVTLEPAALRFVSDQTCAHIPGAVFSGITGNARHQAEGGYHVSREDQSSSNYSVADFVEDRRGPSNLASAIDTTMPTTSMILVTKRLVTALQAGDPRVACIRAVNGTLDGKTAWRWDRSNDFKPVAATADHLWHVHGEWHRKWANDMTAAQGVLSVILGEDDMGQLNAPDPWEEKLNQAAELRNSYYAIMAGYQDDKAGPAGVIARLTRIETALAKVGAPTDVQIGVIADRVAAALVARPDVPLGKKDQPAIVEAVKTALREGAA